MPIIYFFGADGTGKSTLAKNLVKKLNNRNFCVKYAWMRGTHTFASLLAQFLYRFKTFEGYNNLYYNIRIPQNFKRLWQLIEFASAIPIILFKFTLPSVLGSWVIADRYVPDLIAWVSLTTNDLCYPESFEAKFLLALSSKAFAKFYVTATFKELLNRRNGMKPNIVINQLNIYEKIALAIRAIKLDTTKKSVNESIEDVSCSLSVVYQ